MYFPPLLVGLTLGAAAFLAAAWAQKEEKPDDKEHLEHGPGGVRGGSDRQQRKRGSGLHRKGSIADARLVPENLGDGSGDFVGDDHRGQHNPASLNHHSKSVADGDPETDSGGEAEPEKGSGEASQETSEGKTLDGEDPENQGEGEGENQDTPKSARKKTPKRGGAKSG